MTKPSDRLPPSHYAIDGEPYDITMHIGPLWPERLAATITSAPWPMLSYERPANILWNALAAELFANGWTDDAIREWLQSKAPRWELDGELGDHLSALGKLYAHKFITEAQKKEQGS